MAHDRVYLLRWAASLQRTAAATRAHAEAHGAAWEYYDLSLASADAQLRQARAYEDEASLLQHQGERCASTTASQMGTGDVSRSGGGTDEWA